MTNQQSTAAPEFEPEILEDFLAESASLLDQLEADLGLLAHESCDPSTLDQIGRALHTLKGNASFLELASIARIAHNAESALCSALKQHTAVTPTQLGRLREKIDAIRVEIDAFSAHDPAQRVDPSVASIQRTRSIRIDTARFDMLSDLAAELLAKSDQLQSITRAADDAQTQRVQLASEAVDGLARELYAQLERARMQPIEKLLNRYTRSVQTLAHRAGKQIKLVIEGGGTLVDGAVLAALADPITHLLSNACDHGIETPDIRAQRSKQTTGTIQIIVDQPAQHTRIRVIDDGRGLDRAQIESRARALGLITDDERTAHTEFELFRCLLMPRMTTAIELSDLSGRGVGLDIVRTNIECELAGEIHISSELGVGTEITLLIPNSRTRSGASFDDATQCLFSAVSDPEDARS